MLALTCPHYPGRSSANPSPPLHPARLACSRIVSTCVGVGAGPSFGGSLAGTMSFVNSVPRSPQEQPGLDRVALVRLVEQSLVSCPAAGQHIAVRWCS